jgi:hypothetical protein
VFNIQFISNNEIAQGLSEGRAKLLFQHWPPLVGNAISRPGLDGRAVGNAQGFGQLGVAASLLVSEGIDLLVILIVFVHGAGL